MGRRRRRNPDRDQTLSIVAWSAFSGLLLGLFVDALLLGVWVVITTFVPGLPARLSRPGQIAGLVILGMVPAIAAVVGMLEGRLKLR